MAEDGGHAPQAREGPYCFRGSSGALVRFTFHRIGGERAHSKPMPCGTIGFQGRGGSLPASLSKWRIDAYPTRNPLAEIHRISNARRHPRRLSYPRNWCPRSDSNGYCFPPEGNASYQLGYVGIMLVRAVRVELTLDGPSDRCLYLWATRAIWCGWRNSNPHMSRV